MLLENSNVFFRGYVYIFAKQLLGVLSYHAYCYIIAIVRKRF